MAATYKGYIWRGALGGAIGGAVWALYTVLKIFVAGNSYALLGVIYLAPLVVGIQALTGSIIGAMVCGVQVKIDLDTYQRAIIGAVMALLIGAVLRTLISTVFNPITPHALWLRIPSAGVWEGGIQNFYESHKEVFIESFLWESMVGAGAGALAKAASWHDHIEYSE